MNRYIGLGVNPIIADFNFDEGSAASITKTSNIRIAPYKHWTNLWAWYCIKVSGLSGKTMHFLINKSDHYNLVAGERICCWANEPDTDDWHDFDVVNIGAVDIEFYNRSTFVDDTIYVSALPMYSFSRVQRKMGEWRLSPKVSDTISSTNGIIGYATGRGVPDGSGRIIPSLPFYGFKLTNNSGFNKNKCILAACNHATETPGPYQLEGALDWLLSGATNAETLLNWFEFYIYPCTNPQGVWSGWFRSSPEVPGPLNHNNYWAMTGAEESVDAFKAAMAADTGGVIDVGFDYHSIMTDIDIMAYSHIGDTGGNYSIFTAEMILLDGDFDLLTTDLSSTLSGYCKALGASLSLTTEQGGELARGVSNYKTYGENTMKALYEMLIDGDFTYGP